MNFKITLNPVEDEKPKEVTQKTIERVDIVKAVLDVCHKAEMTKWLVSKLPDILFTFSIIAAKAEDIIFADGTEDYKQCQ